MTKQLEDELEEVNDNEISNLDENAESVEEEIIEEEKVEDYRIKSESIRKTLSFRVTSGLVLVIMFLLLRRLDSFSDFNPINSFAFSVITVAILLYCLIVLFVDYSTNENEYYKKTVFDRFKTLNSIYDYFSIVPYLLVVLTILNMFVFSFSPISGTSMEPNFSDNEAVIFSHLTDEYERFDVVIVYVEEFRDPYLIKRVIGLPGETVIIDHNEIFIEFDGLKTKVEQDFIDTSVVKTICYDSIDRDYCTWTLDSDEYFVLGDNRDGNGDDDLSSTGDSLDSRKFDEVNISEIYGKVVFKFKDFNILK